MKKYIIVTTFSLLFACLSFSSVLADNELSRLTQQKDRIEILKGRVGSLIELAEKKNRNDVVLVLQELLLSTDNIFNKIIVKKNSILEEKVSQILEKEIKPLKEEKEIHTFQIKNGLHIDAVSNQVILRYNSTATKENFKDVLLIADQYKASVIANRPDLRLIYFYANNENVVSLMNDFNKIDNIDAYLNMISGENGFM